MQFPLIVVSIFSKKWLKDYGDIAPANLFATKKDLISMYHGALVSSFVNISVYFNKLVNSF